MFLCSSVQDSPPASTSSATSFLWRIDSTPASYFFGTIHVPYVRVWDAVPANAKRAFRRAAHVYLELDLTDHATVRTMSACQLLPEGKHLAQVIPSELYLRIKMYLVSKKKRDLDSSCCCLSNKVSLLEIMS